MIFTKAPILAYPRFGEEFLLETDASGVGLGAVLSQEQPDKTIRPVAFASRTLQQHERNYGISELEGLGVVWAVKHFRHYLYGHRCTVFTDHEALKSLLNTAHPSGKLARWGMALQELDLKIEYRPGKSNGRADALSRYPVSLLTSDCSSTQTAAVIANVDASSSRAESGEGRTLAERQREDPSLAIILAYLPREGSYQKRRRLHDSWFWGNRCTQSWKGCSIMLNPIRPCASSHLLQSAESCSRRLMKVHSQATFEKRRCTVSSPVIIGGGE